MIRTATVNDKAALREIWSAAFGDDRSYADFVIENCLSLGSVLYHPEGMSCLTLFPLVLHRKGKKPLKGFYVYGVATHPDKQKRGYSSLLLYHASKLAKFLVLYPATEPLRSFYLKRGFTIPLRIPAPIQRPLPTLSDSSNNANISESKTLSADLLFSAYQEDALRQKSVFLWSEQLFDFAYRECAFRGGHANKDHFCYPDEDDTWVCKPFVSGEKTHPFVEGLARFHGWFPGVQHTPPLFYLPLD